ncbi:hypothetical protein PIB30_070292 [Stylosanthes scabra]|uniref:F-box associated domain-containing protein n=1 Tax=Stylosanthes scabra TaxID=79078 RepID=A0ABU6QN07_9FABA|nr:hypothetical protein [Stylosanthes scabra]
MDPVYGEATKIDLPMLTPDNGWFRIVGVENGIFLFRFCSTRDRSYLLVWNLAIGSTKMIPDAPRHYCTKCAFLYTFAYFPNSVNYGIVHLYKRDQCQKTWTLTLYSSAEQNWVVMFLAQTEATANYHGLLIHGGKLCLGALNYDHERYSCTIWEIDSVGETPSWNKLLTYDGYGHPYLPAMFIDGDVIQVLEKYYQAEDLQHMKHTIIHITRWSPLGKTQYNLKWMEFDNFVRMRSLSTYYESPFPFGG